MGKSLGTVSIDLLSNWKRLGRVGWWAAQARLQEHGRIPTLELRRHTPAALRPYKNGKSRFFII